MYTAILEPAAISPVLLVLLLILNRRRMWNRKTAAFCFLFTVYFSAVYALVGLPNISYMRFEPNLQLIPFRGLFQDLSGAFLNILLFLPLGFFLRVLWGQHFHLPGVLAIGAGLSLSIELLQMLTFRATDINDLITNTAGTLLGFLLGAASCRILPGLTAAARKADLPLLVGCTALVMFFFQPLVWAVLY